MSFIKVCIAGVFKTVGTANVFKVRVGGAWKDVVFLRVWKVLNGVGQWKEVWLKAAAPPPTPPAPPVVVPPPPPPVPLTVEVSPGSVYGQSTDSGSEDVITSAATALVSGGTPPYTYSWQLMSWSSPRPPFALSPSNSDTLFAQKIPELTGQETATFRCIVGDSLNNTGMAQVDAQFIKALPGDAI